MRATQDPAEDGRAQRLHRWCELAVLQGLDTETVWTTDDVACAVAFLLSDDARFITGEALAVNGGAYMD